MYLVTESTKNEQPLFFRGLGFISHRLMKTPSLYLFQTLCCLLAFSPFLAKGQQRHSLFFSEKSPLEKPCLQDGDGGSKAIEGLSIRICLVDGPDLRLYEAVQFKSEYQLMSTDGFGGLTTFEQDGTGWRGHQMKEATGKKFRLLSFRWFDYGLFNGKPMLVIGRLNGKTVATHSFQGNSHYISIKVSLPADFPEADEIFIVTEDAQGKTFPVLNLIELDLLD